MDCNHRIRMEIPLNYLKGDHRMNLKDICTELLSVMEGLQEGTVHFTYDNLASAMKYGHPVEILDDVIADFVFDVTDGKEPDKKTVENVLKGLKRFKRSFKVKELSKPIKDLTAYLSELS